MANAFTALQAARTVSCSSGAQPRRGDPWDGSLATTTGLQTSGERVSADDATPWIGARLAVGGKATMIAKPRAPERRAW